jgi:hypothetical protein
LQRRSGQKISVNHKSLIWALMPKYVIHIGPPKTGSKYLQSILFHSRADLADQGIYYASDWWTTKNQIQHDPLMNLLRAGNESVVKESFRRINASGYRVVALSCEGFDDLRPPQIKLLHDAIGDNPVGIVYYCRRWSERIPSDWQQHIKMGQFPTLPEFYTKYLRAPSDRLDINYARVLDKFGSVFGRGSLCLVSYNNLKERKIDLFRHCARTFLDYSREVSVADESIQTNTSPDMYDTETIRVMNCLDFHSTGRYRLNMRVRFEQLRKRFDTSKLKEKMAQAIAMLETDVPPRGVSGGC